jgi:hypothetical protein
MNTTAAKYVVIARAGTGAVLKEEVIGPFSDVIQASEFAAGWLEGFGANAAEYCTSTVRELIDPHRTETTR